MQRWWNAHRDDVLCQTDRRWVRSGNQMVPAFESYRRWVGNRTQAEHFAQFAGATPEHRYDALYAAAKSLYSFGQFSLFLYLEALHTITPLDLAPTDLDLNIAHSCRNGLCYAYGYDHWLTESEQPTPVGAHDAIQVAWMDVRGRLTDAHAATTVWNIETTLCAYKKFKRNGKRYIGYYIDRQGAEIAKMEAQVPIGVCWQVLWQFRSETYPAQALAESRYVLAKGIPPPWKLRQMARTAEAIGAAPTELTLL